VNHRSLATTLLAEPTNRLGEPIVLTLEIENEEVETLQLLKSGTPLEDEFTADYLIVEREGEVIPYDGKLVKRGDPSIEAYVVLRPGEKLKTTVEVSAAYSIDRPGDYTVTLNATFLDAFAISGDEKEAARGREDHEPLALGAATVEFDELDP
jgi:hypothetical protein